MVDILVDVGAVEQERVEARLALDHVAAVARVPDEHVVAGAQERHVVAAAAVMTSSPPLPIDDVVAVAAVERQLDLAGLERATRR